MSDKPLTERDCKHGYLARSCPLCDRDALEQEVIDLRAKLADKERENALGWAEAQKCRELLEAAESRERALREALDIERLAAIEHEQWMTWANAVMSEVGEVRRARWRSLMVPYAELSEEMKEHDRKWARKIAALAASKEAAVADAPKDGAEWLVGCEEGTTVNTRDLARITEMVMAAEQRGDEWRKAVEDAAVVNWTLTDGDTPREAVARLLAMAASEALDPRISAEARALLQRGRIKGAEAALRSGCSLIMEADVSKAAARIVAERWPEEKP